MAADFLKRALEKLVRPGKPVELFLIKQPDYKPPTTTQKDRTPRAPAPPPDRKPRDEPRDAD